MQTVNTSDPTIRVVDRVIAIVKRVKERLEFRRAFLGQDLDEDVGAIGGSAAEAYLVRIGAKVQPFKSEAEELQSLAQGRVKYVVEDDVIFTVFQKESPNAPIEALWDIPTPDDIIYGGGYGYARFGIRKEDCQLRVAYSMALAELRGNGFVSDVLKRYGLSDRNLFWFKLAP